jgi:hypothetical protein
MEIAFSFEIDGKPVNPAEVSDAHAAEVMEEVVDTIVARVAGISCPVHHQLPSFICRGKSIDDLALEIGGCCDTLVAAVKARLAN